MRGLATIAATAAALALATPAQGGVVSPGDGVPADGGAESPRVAAPGRPVAASRPSGARAAQAAAFVDVPTRQAAQAVTLDLRALRRAGISLSGSGGARVRAARVTVPARTVLGASRSSARVELDGTLRLRRGARVVVLRELRLTVGRTSTLSARLDGRRVPIATATGGRRAIDPATGIVRLRGARARLTASAATALAPTLGAVPAALGTFSADVDAGNDLAPGGMIDWGFADALRAAADAGVPRPTPAITAFDSAICATAEGRSEGCDPDAQLARGRTRATMHFPVIDGAFRNGRGTVEGQGGLRIVHPPSARTITLESPRLDIRARTVRLTAYVSVDTGDPATTTTQRELELATFTAPAPLHRGDRLAWTTGPGRLSAAATTLLSGVLAPDAALDPMTFSIDAPV